MKGGAKIIGTPQKIIVRTLAEDSTSER